MIDTSQNVEAPMPLPSRAERRKRARQTPGSVADLRARLSQATLAGAEPGRIDRARRLVDAWLGTAEAHRMPLGEVVRAMAGGRTALQLAAALHDEATRDPPPILREAACSEGCAFCCILDGPDGGTITEAEARALHAAVSPLAGQPDGRAWHPAACPALDPETRACRAYEARPTICRSFLSRDAEACRINAEGGSADGAGLLGVHLDYLAVHALIRATLAGVARVETYSLREVAAASVDGADEKSALARARHPARMLDDAGRGAARAASAATGRVAPGPTRP